MKKIDIGQVISVLANLGVLVGLILLVIEVGQNTAALRNETDVAIWSIGTQTGQLVAETPELAELLVRAQSEDWEDFSAIERFRIGLIWDSVVGRLELQYRLYQRSGDVLSREDWVFPESLLSQESFSAWWESQEQWYEPAFTEYLESHIED